MTESQLVRLQADIVNEIKEHKGGSFSEKFRNWKNKEIIQRIEDLDSSNDVLTLKSAIQDVLTENLSDKALAESKRYK